MTDEEIKERAKQIIKEVVEKTDLAFPDFVKKHENENGEIKFSIQAFTKKSGTVFIWYNPLSAVEELIKLLYCGEKEVTFGLPYELAEEARYRYLHAVTYSLLNNFHHEFTDIFVDLPVLAIENFMFAVGLSKNFHPSVDDNLNLKELKLNELSKEADRINDFLGRHRKARLINRYKKTIEFDGPPKIIFALLYEKKLKDWKDAKKCYNQNKKYKAPLDMVKAAFPHLDEDLISKLADPDSYISMPSAIALEDVARTLEIDKPLSLRSLQEQLAESREILNTKTEEEIKQEYTLYIVKKMDFEANIKRIKQMIENDAEEVNKDLQ